MAVATSGPEGTENVKASPTTAAAYPTSSRGETLAAVSGGIPAGTLDGMSYVHRDHVELEPAQPAVATTTRRTTLTRSFSIPAALAGIAAIALIILGAVAIARTDLDSPLSEPIVDVAGIAHNATLGIIEVVAGLVLLLAAVSRSRGAIMFVSIVIGVAAVVALIEPTVAGDTMPLERGFAAVVAIVAAIIVVVAAVTPSVRRTTQVIDAPPA
jgi:hypothetical protein